MHIIASVVKFKLTPIFHSNFGGVPVAPDRSYWASASTWALSYLAVKLFSKNSNVF